MRPVLYESNETDFTSNGLGRPDPVSCEVTEERNGEYELHMVVSVEDPHYEDIVNDRILYAKHDESSDRQPFSIYRITRPINGQAEVYAEHISYRMSHIPVMPFSAGTCAEALLSLKQSAAEDCPFNFWTDKDTIASFQVDTPSSMRSLLGGSDGSLLDVYGGEWEFDDFTAKLHSERGTDRGVTLRYGKNITDLSQEENIQNTYTGILPFWKGTDETDIGTAEDEDTGNSESEEELVTLSEKVLHSDRADNFPYKRTKVVDLSSKFQGKPTEEQLRNAAKSYIKNNDIGVPKVSVKVSFAALWQTEEYKDIAPLERVRLCDTVTVLFSKLGVKTKAKVIKTVYDCLAERYTEIEIGEASSSLSQTIAGDAVVEINTKMENLSTKSYLKRSVERATKLITGGLGGYVMMKTNANGQPEELLILSDDPDYTKASEVWRWNKNGLAYSGTGYEGPYTTAITKDGHIVADFVDTGVLTANIIRSGIIQDMKGNSSWNLDTGKLAMKNGSINIGDGAFAVDENGNVTIQKGTINLGNGMFIVDSSGNVTMKQGSINLGNGNFTVDSDGNVTIKKGTLTANIIRSGTLQDAQGNSSWNLDTGKLSIKDGTINMGNGSFVVDSSGNVTIKQGTINIGSGAFAVDSSGNVTIKQGSINIGRGNFVVDSYGNVTIQSGSINLNDRFIVDSYGNMTASNATLKDTTMENATINAGEIHVGTTGRAHMDFKNGMITFGDNYGNEAGVTVNSHGLHLFGEGLWIGQYAGGGGVAGYSGSIDLTTQKYLVFTNGILTGH